MAFYKSRAMNLLSGSGLAVFGMLALFSFAVPVMAQGEQSGQASQETAADNGDANAAESEKTNPEMEQRQRAMEDQEDMVLESLRDLPYLTIEDTLRYQRELNGVVPPVRADASLLFTSWEHALLREMKQQVVARPTEQGEAEASGRDDDKPREKGIREISLGGIVFVKDGDWTVWLNGQRVTPDAIPPQILDMRVKNSYIEIKWFDSYTNLVYPLRLRPHQRFNLDNRIFLPGVVPSNNG